MENRQKVRGIATPTAFAKVTLLELGDRPGMAAPFRATGRGGIPVDSIVQNIGHGGRADLSFIVPETDLARAEKLLRGMLPELGARDLRWPAGSPR